MIKWTLLPRSTARKMEGQGFHGSERSVGWFNSRKRNK